MFSNLGIIFPVLIYHEFIYIPFHILSMLMVLLCGRPQSFRDLIQNDPVPSLSFIGLQLAGIEPEIS